jgi:hypothetical protein
MTGLSFEHAPAVERLGEQIRQTVNAATSLGDMQLLAPSRCHGWSALDVVVHLRMGLQEMVIGAAPTDEGPDHDAASYWASHPDDRDDDPVPHILWLRRVASAYSRPSAAVSHLRDVAEGASVAVRSMHEGQVEFQGKRMRSGDFLATWVVELAVHQLDFAVDGDEPVGLDWARRTLEAIADADLPSGMDDRSAVLVGLGRVPPPVGVRLSDSFPVSL